MDPNIGKATIGKERTVVVCKESLPTSCGPHRNRFLEVQAEIRARMSSDKKTWLADANASAKRKCDHCWSVDGWIHSQRRNRLDQQLVEKLVRVHTNLVLRESLDDTLRHLLPWDIELVIDETVDEQEEEPEV